MKRKVCLEKVMALLSVPVIIMILLPGLIAAWSGKMNFPITHEVCLAAETIAFVSEDDWNMQDIIVDEESHITPIESGSSSYINVSYSELKTGHPENIRLICHRDNNGAVEQKVMTYCVLLGQDGQLTIDAYPDDTGMYFAHYTYSKQAIV